VAEADVDASQRVLDPLVGDPGAARNLASHDDAIKRKLCESSIARALPSVNGEQ